MNAAREKMAADLLVVGGGVNGMGIACDAAGRGLSVVLCEQGDLAAGTSSASSKLIHGGLRYLEQYEFGLVRESLKERDVLLDKAPHIIWPLRFVLPHRHAVRPAWMIRLGLLLYDNLARSRHLPGSRRIDLRSDPRGTPLQPIDTGFVYSDCWVDDARLVVLNAQAAAEHGAEILTRTRLIRAEPADGIWRTTVEDTRSGETRHIHTRALVNAAGPWVDKVRSAIAPRGAEAGTGSQRIRLVRGSHIVVPRVHDGDHAYILQNADRRIVFVLPYESEYSLIGTTDIAIRDLATELTTSPEEISYLCETVNDYFRTPISPDDVVWSYAGVRPLFDDAEANPSEVTRGYRLDLAAGDTAPQLTVYGGKITTYRHLAEEALKKLKPHFPAMSEAWTSTVPLPGGDIPDGDFTAFVKNLIKRHSGLEPAYLHALARRHGTCVRKILDGVTTTNDLGENFGGGLYGREVDYLVDHEWAEQVDDIAWRRTKCGLRMSEPQRQALAMYLTR